MQHMDMLVCNHQPSYICFHVSGNIYDIYVTYICFQVLQFSSVTQSCLTLCNPMNRSTPGLPVHHQLPEFTQTHAHRVGDAIQPPHLCRPLLLLPPIPPSIRVFSNESTLCMRWPQYWSFSFLVLVKSVYFFISGWTIGCCCFYMSNMVKIM